MPRPQPYLRLKKKETPVAMYRLSASVLSRSQGRSAVAAAAYRAGEKLRNERDGMEHDYSKRHRVLHAEVKATGMSAAKAQCWADKIRRGTAFIVVTRTGGLWFVALTMAL